MKGNEQCGCTDCQNQQVAMEEISDEESDYNDDNDGSDIENTG